MMKFLHQEWTGRVIVGAVFVVLVWALYGFRVFFGIGPMHDHKGDQAPAYHYLAGACILTLMVVCWIGARAIMARKRPGR